MEKAFDPASVEMRIAELWKKEQAFKAGRPERLNAEPFSIVIPPPNVTGSLHMGHALNTTLQDILCRFERMRGKDVLWQPGTDHAGIAAQMVVERQLMEQHIHRRDLGREKFVEKVWEWKEQSGGTIVTQQKRLGASCDWDRERFTMDEGLSRAVIKVFVDLHKQGLVYKDKRLVNWDPTFQTAISDIEVLQIELKSHLWYIRYPLEEDPSHMIVVATTRPETMLGDVAVAVHPEDERYKNLIGKNVILPLVGRRIPIVADLHSDPEKGTGAVKITPAHDFNDFDVGKRHNLPLINIFDSEAHYSLKDNEAFSSNVPESSELTKTLAMHGLPRFTARKEILARLEELDLIEKIEPHTHVVPHGDRSNSVIEPYLTDQWYVDVAPLAAKAIQAVKDGKTKFIPENWEKTFYQWLENVQPWCVSRQLWWGHQIPAWYDDLGNVYVAETEEQALLQSEEKTGRKQTLHRDEDVLDTWFSSALWPFSTFGWPEQTIELKRYYPTSVLVTGFDLIFFWVARMMMLGINFMDDVPFKDVYMHALVRDEKGAKMSKSKGNVIDPLSLIDIYGADSLRFALAAMAAQGRDIKLSVQRIEGYRNFTTKIWNAARFAEINGCIRSETYAPEKVELTLNQWVLSECAITLSEITKALETYRFNDAAGAAYRFIWNIFCDWYLEFSKPVFQGENLKAKEETQATLSFVFDEILKMLHPFMPFLTEELWKIKEPPYAKREQILALTPWSQLSQLHNEQAMEEMSWVIDFISEIRSARAETNVPASSQLPLIILSQDDLVKQRLHKWSDLITRMARLSHISFNGSVDQSAIQLIVGGTQIALPVEGIVDLSAEKQRLSKEIGKIQSEIQKIEGKLNNKDFIAKAPDHVIEEQQERRADYLSRFEKLRDALSRLS